MTDVERLVDACLLPGFAGSDLPDWARRALDGGMAGVALYGANLVDDDAVRRLSAQVHACRAEALVAVDEEGGDVTRLDYRHGSRYPGNHALGVVDDVRMTRAVAAAMAADLRRVGVDVDLAPSVDVNSDAANPVIGVRSFGADPGLVARHGAALIDGLQTGGVIATAKHFPGHGATTADSHHTLPVVADAEAVIRARDLPPFIAAIDAGVLAVMTGHLLMPAFDDVPATLSHRLLSGLLRGELGFGGAIVTDALDMAGVRERHGIDGAAVLALAAGADLLVLGAEDGEGHRRDIHAAVARALREGDLLLSRLEDAARRAGALVAARDGLLGPGDRPRDVAIGGPDIGLEAAARSLRTVGELSPLRSAVVVELRGTTNLAVGSARWSLADPIRDLGALAAAVPVTADGPTAEAVAAAAGATPIVLAVRDAYRSEWQRAWVTAMIAVRPDTVIVCLGLAGDSDFPAAAAVRAHGAARVNTEAAARLLVGRR